MAGKSNIEWTEHTWNPIVGCSIVSPGCTNCYAMRMAARIEKMKSSHYNGTTKKVNGNAVWTGKLALAPDHILFEPMLRKKPTTYFVNSMGDLFHEDAPDEWIDKIVAIMGVAHHHTFQVLTKRAERMRKYFEALQDTAVRDERIGRLVRALSDDDDICLKIKWPLPNVWLGVSAERQQEADERIPHLLQTPAAIRFVSAEPLLGPIDLRRYLEEWSEQADDITIRWHPGLDWVIVGGESGPGARPMHPDWARSLRDQCEAAGVKFFFKQWGEWAPPNVASGDHARELVSVLPDGAVREWASGYPDTRLVHTDMKTMRRVGKKAAGRLLDGKEHNDMPGRVG